MAMIDVEKNWVKLVLRADFYYQIHDELLFEIEEERIEEAKKLLK